MEEIVLPAKIVTFLNFFIVFLFFCFFVSYIFQSGAIFDILLIIAKRTWTSDV